MRMAEQPSNDQLVPVTDSRQCIAFSYAKSIELDNNSSMMELPHNRLLLTEEQKTKDIRNPHHNDVLSGRGVKTNRHSGNESFRRLVGVNKEVYVSSTKRQKMKISRSIVEAVRSLDPPGRFLEKNPDTGLWSDIGHKKAIEKTSQALRDGAASLRKQLSADLGDPKFLNAVFDFDTDTSNSHEESKIEIKGEVIEKAKDKGKDKENKVGISEKSKTTKTKPTVVKKGNRRTKSSPCTLTSSSVKHFRRETNCGSPVSPFSRRSESTIATSACSTPVSHSMSHPSTPITWNGRASYSDGLSPASFNLMNTHSSYDPSTQRYPSSYGYTSRRRQCPRPQYYDYPHTPSDHWHEPPHHHHWESYEFTRCEDYAYSGKSLQHVKHPLSGPPAFGDSQTRAHLISFAPSGPLLPGRHQFSPAGYRSKPPPPDWSPRMTISRRQKHHHSTHHHSSYDESYQSRPSAHWTRSPHSQDTFVLSSGCAKFNDASSSSLSVPSLGGEIDRAEQSTRVMLAPRSRRLFGALPKSSPGRDLNTDFAPPPPSFSLVVRGDRDVKRGKVKGRCDHDIDIPCFRAIQASLTGEGKIMDDNEKNVVCPVLSSEGRTSSSSPVGVSLKPRPCYSRSESIPSLNFSPKEDAVGEEEPGCDRAKEEIAVEDIVMSSIPFGREDPMTLMSLPENILTLPISPCGPNDNPAK